MTSISVAGRPVCNLYFTDNIDLMAGSNSENLTNKLVERANAYGMELNRKKSKVMVNSTCNTNVCVTIDGEPLEEVSSFKYLRAALSKDGTCNAEIHTPITTTANARLERIWKNNISFHTKLKLYKLLVILIFLYRSETWTLLVEASKRIQAFENKCLRRPLHIS